MKLLKADDGEVREESVVSGGEEILVTPTTDGSMITKGETGKLSTADNKRDTQDIKVTIADIKNIECSRHYKVTASRR